MSVVQRSNGIYYVRKVIPLKIRIFLGLRQREFVKSLETKNFIEARKRAEPILRTVEEHFHKIQTHLQILTFRNLMTQKKDEEFDFEPITIPDPLMFIDRIKVDKDGYEISGLQMDPNHIDAENEMFSQVVAQIEGRRPKTQTENESMKVTELIEKFCSDKALTESWKIFDVEGNRRKLLRFVEVVGDLEVDQFTLDHAEMWREFVNKLPPYSQKMTVNEILNNRIKERLTDKTKDTWFGIVSSMMNWAIRKHVATKNVFNNLQKAQKRREDTERRDATIEEINILKNYLKFNERRPSRYWVPIIGIWTGMRLSEICQLLTTDIKQVDGIWTIDVNDEGEKSVKTPSSVRLIPIHSKLIELGLLDYWKKQSKGRPKQLFTEIESTYGKFGHEFSKWFGRERRKMIKNGILPESSKDFVFHSLRHSFITNLRDAGAQETFVAQMTGHSQTGKTMAWKRYAKKENLIPLIETIEMLNY